jgi:hypothetical protein
MRSPFARDHRRIDRSRVHHAQDFFGPRCVYASHRWSESSAGRNSHSARACQTEARLDWPPDRTCDRQRQHGADRYLGDSSQWRAPLLEGPVAGESTLTAKHCCSFIGRPERSMRLAGRVPDRRLHRSRLSGRRQLPAKMDRESTGIWVLGGLTDEPGSKITHTVGRRSEPLTAGSRGCSIRVFGEGKLEIPVKMVRIHPSFQLSQKVIRSREGCS